MHDLFDDFSDIDDSFIERHSRQLVLKDWSLDLQKHISSYGVSIEFDSMILVSYLICAGFENFYLKYPSYAANIDAKINTTYPEEQCNVIFSDIKNSELHSVAKVRIYTDFSDTSVTITYYDKSSKIPEIRTYYRINADIKNNYGYLFACNFFIHKIKQNYNSSTNF